MHSAAWKSRTEIYLLKGHGLQNCCLELNVRHKTKPEKICRKIGGQGVCSDPPGHRNPQSYRDNWEGLPKSHEAPAEPDHARPISHPALCTSAAGCLTLSTSALMTRLYSSCMQVVISLNGWSRASKTLRLQLCLLCCMYGESHAATFWGLQAGFAEGDTTFAELSLCLTSIHSIRLTTHAIGAHLPSKLLCATCRLRACLLLLTNATIMQSWHANMEHARSCRILKGPQKLTPVECVS